MLFLTLLFCMTENLQQSYFYENWVEKTVSRYAGEYAYFEFEGSEIKQQLMVTLTYKHGKLTATKKDGEKEIASGGCVLTGNNFRMDGKGWKEDGRLS